MNLEEIRKLCTNLPGVTEDIKWGNDLCFCIGGKMFLVTSLDKTPVSASFKTTDEQFEALIERDGFKPAPYVAKYKWVLVDDLSKVSKKEWVFLIKQSYELVKRKLPKKKK